MISTRAGRLLLAYAFVVVLAAADAWYVVLCLDVLRR